MAVHQLFKIALLCSLQLFGLKTLAADMTRVSVSPEIQEYAYSKHIVLRVNTFDQAVKIYEWLDIVALSDIGKRTLQVINSSRNRLLIYHSTAALYSAGTTSASMTSNLTNGVGEDASIAFYADMDHLGTNCVLGQQQKYIEFTAAQNLFHELSHARHYMEGTWLYSDSEAQAIREENIFRREMAHYQGSPYFARSEHMEYEEVTLRKNATCQQYQTASN